MSLMTNNRLTTALLLFISYINLSNLSDCESDFDTKIANFLVTFDKELQVVKKIVLKQRNDLAKLQMLYQAEVINEINLFTNSTNPSSQIKSITPLCDKINTLFGYYEIRKLEEMAAPFINRIFKNFLIPNVENQHLLDIINLCLNYIMKYHERMSTKEYIHLYVDIMYHLCKALNKIASQFPDRDYCQQILTVINLLNIFSNRLDIETFKKTVDNIDHKTLEIFVRKKHRHSYVLMMNYLVNISGDRLGMMGDIIDKIKTCLNVAKCDSDRRFPHNQTCPFIVPENHHNIIKRFSDFIASHAHENEPEILENLLYLIKIHYDPDTSKEEWEKAMIFLASVSSKIQYTSLFLENFDIFYVRRFLHIHSQTLNGHIFFEIISNVLNNVDSDTALHKFLFCGIITDIKIEDVSFFQDYGRYITNLKQVCDEFLERVILINNENFTTRAKKAINIMNERLSCQYIKFKELRPVDEDLSFDIIEESFTLV